MRPSDIGGLTDASDPRVSPDGRWIAFVVTSVDLESNEYRSRVWVAGADGASPPRPLTAGDARDSRPRWAPDGRALAFVSHRDGKGSTLHVLPFGEPGEVTTVVSWPEEIEELAFAPDGARLAFTARLRDEETYGKDADKDRPARRIDRLVYRYDSIGWTVDRPRHLFVVPADGSARPTDLTPGPVDVAGAAWSPDGTRLAFSSGRHDTWDLDLAVDLFAVEARDGAEPQQLTPTGQAYSRPSWSPDGTRIAFVWSDRMNLPVNGQVGVLHLDEVPSSGQLLTTSLDRHCAPYLAGAREPVWAGDDLFFQAEDRGSTHIYRVPAGEGGKPELVSGGDRVIGGFDLAGGALAFTAADPSSLAEVFAAAPSGGGERQLTTIGRAFVERVTPSLPERFVATSADGTEVEAWIIRPSSLEPGVRYPTLVNIHGGPFTQYGQRLFDEFQIQAEAGYAIVYSNPRGSSGYGEAWGRAIRGPKAAVDPGTGWGSVDFEDVMAVTEEAVRRFDFVDGDRLGVLGGSYGGYMTSWIVGHSDRFKAACSERAVNNMLSSCWTSDIGPFFDSGYLGVSYLDDPAELLRVSPVSYVKNITTPLLILHSENDLRCPVEQAEQLFVALRLLGRDVEFHRFPGESHELSRAGAPKHRVQRMELLLDFFDRHLKR